MRMEKRKFRIGELAEHLAVEKFVIRFWEKEFNVRPKRSDGGQRFYDENDARTFAAIKDLLYNRGFTIAGARKELPNLIGARLLKNQDITEPNPVTPVHQSREMLSHIKVLKKLKEELTTLRNYIEKWS